MKTHRSSSPLKVKVSPPRYLNFVCSSVVKWKLWLRPLLPKLVGTWASSRGKNALLSNVCAWPLGWNTKKISYALFVGSVVRYHGMKSAAEVVCGPWGQVPAGFAISHCEA